MAKTTVSQRFSSSNNSAGTINQMQQTIQLLQDLCSRLYSVEMKLQGMNQGRVRRKMLADMQHAELVLQDGCLELENHLITFMPRYFLPIKAVS